jgi:hypothetical protein
MLPQHMHPVCINTPATAPRKQNFSIRVTFEHEAQHVAAQAKQGSAASLMKNHTTTSPPKRSSPDKRSRGVVGAQIFCQN